MSVWLVWDQYNDGTSSFKRKLDVFKANNTDDATAQWKARYGEAWGNIKTERKGL